MIQLPYLEVARTYRRSEVAAYIALQGVQHPKVRTDDYTVATSGFPHRDCQHKYQHRQLWAEGHHREIVIEYTLFEVERFASRIELIRSNLAAAGYTYEAAHLRKVEDIKTRLNQGEPAFPVWIEKHLVHCDPMPVKEGNHRLLAFADLGLPLIPVFMLKYADPDQE